MAVKNHANNNHGKLCVRFSKALTQLSFRIRFQVKQFEVYLRSRERESLHRVSHSQMLTLPGAEPGLKRESGAPVPCWGVRASGTGSRELESEDWDAAI